jgi:hypothetical protein
MRYQVNEEVQRIDLFDERWYYIKDKDVYYPSVNEILSIIDKGSQFNEWLKNNGHNSEIIMDRAGKFGTKVHELIERFLKKQEVSYELIDGFDSSTQIWHRFLIWCTWFKSIAKDIEYSEDTIEIITYDIEHKYAGTCDLFCKYKGEYAVIDWKTGNTVGDKEEMQLTAYARALEKKLNVKIPKSYIMWMPSKAPNKNGYRIIEIENSNEIFSSFLSAKDLWYYKNAKSKPKLLQFPMSVSLESLNDIELITNVGEKQNGTY